MSITNYFVSFNKILLKEDQMAAAGATVDGLDLLFNNKNLSDVFFKPMRTVGSLKKFYTPITAPIAFGIVALESLIGVIEYVLKGIYHALIHRDTSKFSRDMYKLYINLVIAGAMLVSAVASPILNLVDLAGSIINTGIELFCTKNAELDNDFETASFSHN